ncbi:MULTISPECIES: hypothetical protein [Phenylobacterium]|uniref:Uncharacterized protein n=1 Tax=Phenylobacterium koreense TaxID=266125 RepID=A0ABV2EIJ8_9CAUL
MNFLRTAPFGTLFTAAFAIGAACHLAFLIIEIIVALAAPGVFTLNGSKATNPGEALGAVAIMFIVMMFLNAGVSAFGSLCWLAVRRWMPKKAAAGVGV